MDTITDSFKKCGFYSAKKIDETANEISSDFKLRDIPEFRDIVNKYVKMLGKFNVVMNFTHFVEFDKNLATSRLTEEQCIKIENEMNEENLDEASCIQLDDDDDQSTLEMECFEVNSNANSVNLGIEHEETSSNEERSVTDTPISVSNSKHEEASKSSTNESEDYETENELKMSRINMIRHIGDLKLFAAQRESKEYGKRLLATICQLEKQIFDEPRERQASSNKRNDKK